MPISPPQNNNDLFPSNLGPEYVGFDHIHWWVGNAKQAASYYITRMGFRPIAYRGPETGSACLTSYVVRNGDAVFVLTAPVCAPGRSKDEQQLSSKATEEDRAALATIHAHLTAHGDGVRDVAFRIKGDIGAVWKRAVTHGAEGIASPATVVVDGHGAIRIATIGTYGDTVHSLVNRDEYSAQAPFLPGYRVLHGDDEDPINTLLPPIEFVEIDHCVGNQPWGVWIRWCDSRWNADQAHELNADGKSSYEECLDFHRYWTVDDKDMCSEYSAMRSIVVASPNETIKMPMNEPATGKKKSQIQEFVEYYHGPGVQHIAFLTLDIVTAVSRLRSRGVQFLQVPPAYYTDLRARLSHVPWTLDADLAELQRLNVLVDFDERGYLLQIFAKHVGDRPTVFVEVIQRRGFDGFGAGNFKSLFEAFEREQARRGTL
ncbi:hypothetical protein N7510_008451 [Penicillium lagena]|uniref:uncharacterized protein n=1 Tax=Penicillium lagena TaxID=94218 RepID=UPI00253F9878|nr:uncharacterized protein N7510_008451 [Penicillium lagena]KAJ5605670.1 hypothetical protein N7510_008451 [Penicillium lagena]